MRLLVPACVLLACACVPAWAGEDEPPKPAPAPKEAPEAAPAAPVAPVEGRRRPGGLTRKDIEELVRRGGRLPEGYVPHGMRPPPGQPGDGALHREPPAALVAAGRHLESAFARATGQLILKYLAEKDDPARAPVYEELLGAMGTLLAGEGGEVRSRLPKLVALLGRGLRDARTRDVYSEVLQLFVSTIGPQILMEAGPPTPSTPTPTPRAGPSPADPTTAAWPRTLGGAQMLYRIDPQTAEVAVLVGRVPDGSLAAEAALRPGDALLAFDGEPADPARLRHAVETTASGGTVEITVRARTGDRARTLLRGPVATRKPALHALSPGALEAGWPRTFGGAEIAYLTMAHVDMAPVFAVVRVPIDSPAAQASLAPGDIIVALDDQPATVAGLRHAARAFTPGGKLRVKLRRRNGSIDILDLEFAAEDAEASDPNPGK